MIRLDKFLSEMSGWTRSEVKKIVRTGSVTVDGNEVKKPETKIDEKLSIVRVDGRQIKYNKYEYYMLNKPKGFVSATTDREHKTVVDIISSSEKNDLFPVGRLDIDTEGLLLITNDGELAHRLLSPKNHVEKTYYVEVSGILDDADVDAVEKGLDIGEEKNTIPAKMEILKTDIQNNISSCYLTIHEGKFHQVKRMMKKLGKTVTYLKRVSMGSLILDSKLKKGNYRKLSSRKIHELKNN